MPGSAHAVTCQRFQVRCSRPRQSCIDHDLTLSKKSINLLTPIYLRYETTRCNVLYNSDDLDGTFVVENPSPLFSFSKPPKAEENSLLVASEEEPL